MMPIKIRFWDDENKKMIYEKDFDEGISEYYLNVNGKVFSQGEDEMIEEKNIKPLLFIGLKDKNGKEIYEGDIIREDNLRTDKSIYNTNIGIVEWTTQDVGSCGCCYEAFIGVGFVLKLIKKAYDLKFGNLVNSDMYIKLEVIGNIYENPELLK